MALLHPFLNFQFFFLLFFLVKKQNKNQYSDKKLKKAMKYAFHKIKKCYRRKKKFL